MDWRDRLATKPGYQVVSPSFVAVFIAGNRAELEKRRNWHVMMMELLNSFEMWPRDMARVGSEAAINWIFRIDLNIRDIGVHISSDTFSQKPGDRIKTVVHVHITDYYGTQSTVIFEVKKKPKLEMKMLQTLAAETILSCISKKEDVECLEVPKELLRDLNKAYDEIWRVDGRSISLSKSCSPSRHRPSIMKNTGDVASEAEAVLRRRSIHSLYHRLYGFCCIIEY